jgi:NADH:ubiquinone oxidoreductase subunit C
MKTRLGAYFLSLIDIVGLDLTKLRNYNLFFNTGDMSLPPKFFERCVVYNTFDYKLSARYSFWCFANTPEYFTSLERTFSNSNWLERELVEFFNIKLTARTDTRNLLLDYNFTANPLLKSYPTEGHQEIFFNHLSYNLEYVGAEFVEL